MRRVFTLQLVSLHVSFFSGRVKGGWSWSVSVRHQTASAAWFFNLHHLLFLRWAAGLAAGLVAFDLTRPAHSEGN